LLPNLDSFSHFTMLDYFCRLNKIGKNPAMVAQHNDEDSQNPESKTISAVVNALAEQADHVSSSEESMHPGPLGKALHRLNLPRPKSESNFSSQELHVGSRGGPPAFHKSDTFHRESSFH
jgi:hyperpolarization activated cyclic nucleotide-gated potassium channel 2